MLELVETSLTLGIEAQPAKRASQTALIMVCLFCMAGRHDDDKQHEADVRVHVQLDILSTRLRVPEHQLPKQAHTLATLCVRHQATKSEVGNLVLEGGSGVADGVADEVARRGAGAGAGLLWSTGTWVVVTLLKCVRALRFRFGSMCAKRKRSTQPLPKGRLFVSIQSLSDSARLLSQHQEAYSSFPSRGRYNPIL